MEGMRASHYLHLYGQRFFEVRIFLALFIIAIDFRLGLMYTNIRSRAWDVSGVTREGRKPFSRRATTSMRAILLLSFFSRFLPHYSPSVCSSKVKDCFVSFSVLSLLKKNIFKFTYTNFWNLLTFCEYWRIIYVLGIDKVAGN